MQSDYEIEMKGMDQTEDSDLLKMALILEERERRFFSEVSDKVPLPEVGRIFRKVAQKKERSLAKLKTLGLNQLLLGVVAETHDLNRNSLLQVNPFYPWHAEDPF